MRAFAQLLLQAVFALLGLYSCSDVTNGCRHQDSFWTLQRAQHDLDGEIAAILAASLEFNPRTNLLRQRLSRSSGTVSEQPFREAPLDDVLDLLAEEFVAVVSEPF